MKAFGHEWTNTMEGGRVIDRQRQWMRFDSEAVWTDSNGNINLGIKTSPMKVRYKDKEYDTKYAVGVLRSKETFGNGLFSAEIKLPKGSFLWPSFWLVGDGPWPASGEIDIMEAWSDGDGSYFRPFLPRWRTSTNMHYEQNGHAQAGSCDTLWIMQTKNPSENFIKYDVLRTDKHVVFMVNGRTVRTIRNPKEIARSRMNVIFDLWTYREDFTLDTPMVIKSFSYKPS